MALRTTQPPKQIKKNVVLNKRGPDKNKQAKRNPTKIIARSETPSSRDVELDIGDYTIKTIENEMYESEPDCGLRLSSYIVGGSNAMEGSYPWMAGILGFGTTFLAGAVVINEWWALTAAHNFE